MALSYRLERILSGERGTVLKVESLTSEIRRSFSAIAEDLGDESKELPQLVTFINPLGEIVQALAPSVTWNNSYDSAAKGGVPRRVDIKYYKYSPGDPFP